MTATNTTPPRVLTEEQHEKLWELFCSYGRLRWEAESAMSIGRDFEESQRLRREADEVQERFLDLLLSVTELPS